MSPSLDLLAADPGRALDLRPEVARDLLARLSALQVVLLAQAFQPPTDARGHEASEEAQLLTIPQVAGLLGVPKSYAYDLARRGILPTVRVGPKYVRVNPTDLRVWVDAHREKALDRVISVTLTSGDDRLRRATRSKTARSDSSRIRQARRRPRRNGQPMGTRPDGRPGVGGPAHPAPGEAGEDA